MKKPIKPNTAIQRAIRQKKKENEIITVTLEMKKNEYRKLQKIGEFLCLGDIKQGQKGVIKTYTNIFSYLLNYYNEHVPDKKTKAKKFYRRCAIAKYYKQTSGLNDNDIVAELNKLKVIVDDELSELTPPQQILNTNKEEYKEWNLDNFKESLDPDFLANGIKKMKYKKRLKKSNKKKQV